ncbi:MBL fold metallo-hydrolase [Stutzerimonas kunmingensis]|uniref:MBL fold metallo-hydrolase n=1 Tax=Stutzerimonas kunmingensis TaxID=1211807 RepID=UPI0037D70091
MLYPHILHHGAVNGVTGSCHELHVSTDTSYLIDCGLFQDADTFGTSQARGISHNQREVEWYVALVQQRIIALPYSNWFTLSDTAVLASRVRLQRAGHILGSAHVEFDLTYPETGEKKRVAFSGDLRGPHAQPAPRAPYGADIRVIESTYGDRQHEDRRTQRQRLQRVIDQALEDSGTVLIPAFSIGRTQESLYELEDFIHRVRTKPAEEGERGRNGSTKAFDSEANWPELPVILDSPLASRFTAAYRELQPFWNREALKRVKSGRRPLGVEQLITVDSHSDHTCMVQHLSRTARPAIVIAGNGMCSIGRIVNYLKAMLGDRHNVLFVVYQAAGTPGHALQSFGPKGGYVDLEGERLDTKAGVATIGGVLGTRRSRWSDQVRFRTRKPPLHIRIVHGEPKAKQAIRHQCRRNTYGDGMTVKPSVFDIRPDTIKIVPLVLECWAAFKLSASGRDR